jgi:hypothetical protein
VVVHVNMDPTIAVPPGSGTTATWQCGPTAPWSHCSDSVGTARQRCCPHQRRPHHSGPTAQCTPTATWQREPTTLDPTTAVPPRIVPRYQVATWAQSHAHVVVHINGSTWVGLFSTALGEDTGRPFLPLHTAQLRTAQVFISYHSTRPRF